MCGAGRVSPEGSDQVREAVEGTPEKATLEPRGLKEELTRQKGGADCRRRQKQQVQRPCDECGPCRGTKSEREGSARDVGRTRPRRPGGH